MDTHMLFCYKCGAQAVEGADFCARCGTPLVSAPPAQSGWAYSGPRSQPQDPCFDPFRYAPLPTGAPETASTPPAGFLVDKRSIVLVAGFIQILIGARIILLLCDARTSNGIVAVVMDWSNVFIAPFGGILQGLNLVGQNYYLYRSGSVIDVTALLALVGWTAVELAIFWAMGIFRKGPTATTHT